MIKTYNKLVRDRIPEIIENSGKTCVTEILSDEDYLRMLDAKLDEELAEYNLKKSDNPMYEIDDDVCECCSEWNKDEYHCDDNNCKKAIVCWLQKEVEKEDE